MKINGHQVESSMETLAEIEVALGTGGGGSAARFRRIGRWLVQEGFLTSELSRRWKLASGPAAELPSLSAISSRQILMKRLLGEPWKGSSVSQAVFFKSNLRAFYLGSHGVSIKMRGPARSLENFRTDVDARAAVLESHTVEVPPLIHVDLAAVIPFLCEELVPGTTAASPHGHRLILERFLPQMLHLYGYFGIEEERLGTYFDLERLAGALASANLPGEWKREEACRCAMIHCLTAERGWSDAGIPISVGHGDLSPENMIVSAGDRIVVVDWELSGRMPLAWDLRKLLARVPGAGARIFDLLQERLDRSVTGGMLPLGQQLITVAAAQVAATLQALESTGASADDKAVPRLRRRLKREFASAARFLEEAGVPVH